MSKIDKDTLLGRAVEIREATEKNSNTALKVGSLLYDMIDSMDPSEVQLIYYDILPNPSALQFNIDKSTNSAIPTSINLICKILKRDGSKTTKYTYDLLSGKWVSENLEVQEELNYKYKLQYKLKRLGNQNNLDEEYTTYTGPVTINAEEEDENFKVTSIELFLTYDSNIIQQLNVPVLRSTTGATGAKGDTGAPVVRISLDNEMDSIPCDVNGITTEGYAISSTIRVYKGATRITSGVSVISVDSINGVAATVNDFTPPVSDVTQGVATILWYIPTNKTFQLKKYSAQIQVRVNNVDYWATFIVNIIKAAKPGTSPIIRLLKPDPSNILFKQEDTGNKYLTLLIQRTEGDIVELQSVRESGLTVKYSFTSMPEDISEGTNWLNLELQSNKLIVAPTRKNIYIAAFDPDNNDILIDKETIPVLRDGKDGLDGVDGKDGRDGIDGVTTYTWIRYADEIYYNDQGAVTGGKGMSNDPIGQPDPEDPDKDLRKKYIGFAYNKSTEEESDLYSAYKWTDFIGSDGTDGIDGEKGEAGKTYYTWIKYSKTNTIPTSEEEMSEDPTPNTYWIGIATNQETREESSNPSDYTWSKYRGDDGVPGPQGPEGPQGPKGEPGGVGRFYYYAGDWSDIVEYNLLDPENPIIKKPLTVNNTSAPFVYDGTVSENEGYYICVSLVPSNYLYYPSPANGNPLWEKMLDFTSIISEAVFSKFAKLGSFIINKDWMLSQHGTLGGKTYDSVTVHTGENVSTKVVPYTLFKPVLNLDNEEVIENDTLEANFLDSSPEVIVIPSTGKADVDYDNLTELHLDAGELYMLDIDISQGNLYRYDIAKKVGSGSSYSYTSITGEILGDTSTMFFRPSESGRYTVRVGMAPNIAPDPDTDTDRCSINICKIWKCSFLPNYAVNGLSGYCYMNNLNLDNFRANNLTTTGETNLSKNVIQVGTKSLKINTSINHPTTSYDKADELTIESRKINIIPHPIGDLKGEITIELSEGKIYMTNVPVNGGGIKSGFLWVESDGTLKIRDADPR